MKRFSQARPAARCQRPAWLRSGWGSFVLLVLPLISCLGPVPQRCCAAPQLSWEDHGAYRSAPLTITQPGKTGFTRLAPAETGLTFTNALSEERATANRNLLSGAGVAAGDIDGDGLVDLYFAGLDSDNRLYRNLGNFRFEEITDQPVLACPRQDSTGAAFADLDGDGDLDLLVTALGKGTRIFENDGRGRFREITETSGVASSAASMSMALADIDGDGDLDLYVVNYRPTTIRDRPAARFKIQVINNRPVVVEVDGRPTTAPDLTNRFDLGFSGEIIEHGEADSLYLNDGRGRFTALSFTDGAFLDEDGRPLEEPFRDWGLSVRFHDFTGDGAPDIYVCNDLHPPDRAWVNDGQGRFRALPRLALRHTSNFSMGVDFGDLDRDGHVDFYVVDMVSREPRNRKIQIAGVSPVFCPIGLIDNRPLHFQNTLQLNRGDGTFAEIAHYAGLEASEWSWHPVLLDVDLDGYEDILVPNGMLRDFQNFDLGRRVESEVASRRVPLRELVGMFREFSGLHLPNILFHNRGDLTFEDRASAWGFDAVGISQGMALADLDNDGDLDVITNDLNAEPGVFRNDTAAPRIAVRLAGRAPNTRGIGGQIKVLGGPVSQSQEIIAGGRYLSSDDPMRVFAAGTVATNLTIEVAWRDGRKSVVKNARPNWIYEVREESSVAVPPALAPQPDPWFEDVSELLGHRHYEEPFEDFARQILLPNMLSQLGPGLSWTDLDGDGRDDLLIATGRGGTVAAFVNDGRGGFLPYHAPPFDAVATRDVTTLLTWPRPGAPPAILAGSSNFEDGLEQGAVARLLDLQSGAIVDALPGQFSSTGPMSLADVDGDGDLDLFVGGRTLPGRYPEPATSLLFLNQAGQLRLDPRSLEAFAHVGLVSGSVFSDLDLDGDPDLILACEWGPVRVFRNERGVFTDVTAELGLAAYTGWWNGVTTADLDGDGRPDIIASNWGLNTRYRATPAYPRRIYYGDLYQNGVVQVIEALYDHQLIQEVPERDLSAMATAMPALAQRYPTHTAFAQISIDDLLDPSRHLVRSVEATTLASTVFLNRGGRFEAQSLPPEAQFAPAFAICVADFDGDGHEDLFLSQNFFTVQPFTMRNDAGRGLWLRGDGQGGLSPVPGHESGFLIYGDQRGAAVADFDLDGRVDLAVSQNAYETKLFRNVRAKPGLRVRLLGPPHNPSAIGAVIRLQFGDQLGPAREVRAGAGYWSQDSPVQVLGFAVPPDFIQVRWPDGLVSRTPVRPGMREAAIRWPQPAKTLSNP